MAQPWDEFFDIYREKRADAPHGDAVVDALVGLMFHLDDEGWTDYGERTVRLKEAADRWNEEDGDDWAALRQELERCWTKAG